MVVALHAVSIVVNSSIVGAEGIDYPGTAGDASNQWRTMLREVYAGMADAAGTNVFARDCNSAARKAIVNNWDNVFHGTVTACADSHPSVAGAGINGYDQNNAILESGIRHAFRRNDAAGANGRLPSTAGPRRHRFRSDGAVREHCGPGGSVPLARRSPFCNNKRPDDDWQPTTLAANATFGFNSSQIPEMSNVGVPASADQLR